MIALIGGGAAAVILIVVLIIVLVGGHRIVGTWENTDSGTWLHRIEFSRNGTGTSFEVNVNTGAVRDEMHMRWEIQRIFNEEILEIVLVDPFDPFWVDTERFSFNIIRSPLGDEILILMLDEWWGTETTHFRRVR